MVKLLKYIISGMVSMVALNYLIDLFGICKIIAPAKDEIIRLPKKNICVFEEDITERFIERVLK